MGIILILFYLMDPSATRNDPDTFFHLQVGKEMLHEGKIIREAIHTYSGEHLPYVPHEAGFQLVSAWLYTRWGWNGLHLFTVFCLALLVWGLYRLTAVSRKECGLEPVQPYFVLFIPVVALYIFLTYFKIRPQMFSAPLTVWFVVWLREFQLSPSWKKGGMLGLISLILSNFHAGVWPVIAVFYGMAVIESLLKRAFSIRHLMTGLLIALGGVLNAGGIHTLLYFHTVGQTGFTQFIQEWHPISFSSDKYYFAVLLLFLWSASHSVKQSVFRKLFFTGILYLGLSNYKEFLYLLLFILYFLAISIERIPWLQVYKNMTWMTRPRFLIPVTAAGLILNLFMGWMTPYQENKTDFPVQEMTYILNHHRESRPKVLATYVTSAYIMFRGGDILADGRYDPFVTDQTKGIHGWTAFERSLYAFESDEVMSIIREDHPDYLIMPKKDYGSDGKNQSWEWADITRNSVRQALGKPVYTGPYGEVYQLRSSPQ